MYDVQVSVLAVTWFRRKGASNGVCLCPGLLCGLRQVASALWAPTTSSGKSDFAFFPGFHEGLYKPLVSLVLGSDWASPS